MSFAQDISPLNSDIMDALVRTDQLEWIARPRARVREGAVGRAPEWKDGGAHPLLPSARAITEFL
jgi:hypothetical protein